MNRRSQIDATSIETSSPASGNLFPRRMTFVGMCGMPSWSAKPR